MPYWVPRGPQSHMTLICNEERVISFIFEVVIHKLDTASSLFKVCRIIRRSRR